MPRRMFYNKSIHKFNRISFFFASLLTVLIILLVTYNAYSEYQVEIQKLEKDYYASQKEFVKKETQRALDFIKYKYNKDRNHKSLNALQDEIIDAIEQMRNDRDGTGYVFIYNFDGINIADPILKQNAGKNLIDFTDPNGKKVIYELIEISKKPSGGYVEYVWNKPTTNTLAPKISYASSFKPWNWMIGSGVYIDEIEKVLKLKKKEYNEKVITYIVQILMLASVLFISGMMIYQYFTNLIQHDIEKIRKSLNDFNVIDIDDLTFKEFQQVAVHINDMTKELKELNTNLEEKVEKRTIELKKSEQFAHNLVEAQDKFIKNAIHEINTPLSIIITNIDLFKLKFENNKYLSKIEAGSKIIHNIYNDLSYLVKKDRIQYPKTNIDFSSFCEFRIDFFDEIATGNNLEIVPCIEKNIEIEFNETQLQRICDNSLSNAIKYSYDGTTIEVKLYKKDDFVYLEFHNTGDTIEEPKKLFERFYRGNDARGGFGLGLNIIQEICEKNQVNVEVSSSDHKTVFEYKFPLYSNK